MINLETVKILRSLRLPVMAGELESQLEDPQRYKGLTFEDRIALLVDAESLSRRQNTVRRRIKDARLSESTASVEAIEYHEDRGLDNCIYCFSRSSVYSAQSARLSRLISPPFSDFLPSCHGVEPSDFD